jgi:hypothetical protein
MHRFSPAASSTPTPSDCCLQNDLHNFLRSMHGDNTIFAAEIVHALTDICLKGKGRIEFGRDESGL